MKYEHERYNFQKGQTVYVLGEYRAKVTDCSPDYGACDVYEGLYGDIKVDRLTYATGLVEATKRKALTGRTAPENLSA